MGLGLLSALGLLQGVVSGLRALESAIVQLMHFDGEGESAKSVPRWPASSVAHPERRERAPIRPMDIVVDLGVGDDD